VSDPLPDLVREIEAHVAAGGWDQPPRLFALVPTADLLAREPHLATALAADSSPEAIGSGSLTPVEQEELPDHATLEELLGGIGWPAEVSGAALVVERLMLPPAAEADLPDDDQAALAALTEHPARQEVRLAVAVLRDGRRHGAVRLRAHDDPRAVLNGPDLVPGLADGLAATLHD